MDAVTVVAARGFRAGGIRCGIKPSPDLDLTLLAADHPVAATGVFTTSLTAAPPVHLSRTHLESGEAMAVVVNSGAANAGTGTAGLADARSMAAATARQLGCDETDVLVCSTGPIGGRLPLDLILAGIPPLATRLGGTPEHGAAAARGILTTDSIEKTVAVESDGWVVGGMAKGAGMVRPDMATMLAFLTTDAVADTATLSDALRPAVDATFNALNIDGCQSTNDTVILLASGASGVKPDVNALSRTVEEACRGLVAQMARDAEGASKVVTVAVAGTQDDRSARRVGMAVADSSLVRASFYGADPNWGRVLAAVGAAGEKIDPGAVRIVYDRTVVCDAGVAVDFDEAGLAARLDGDFSLQIVVGDGPGRALVTTTDLTPAYVIFNGERS